MKSGLKVNLQFLLIKAAKIFKATAITESNMKETEIFDRFLCVFNISKVSKNLWSRCLFPRLKIKAKDFRMNLNLQKSRNYNWSLRVYDFWALKLPSYIFYKLT